MELGERLAGSGIIVNGVSPGLVATDLMREHSLFTMGWLRPLWRTMLLTPEQAAERIVRVATSPASGTVTGQCFAGSDRTILVPFGARNAGARRQLWDLSAQLTRAPEVSAIARGDR
jgi:NAD(P)-dependent dehydrogenase (short-subunit alcohol dehydrogenase family)